MFYPNKASKIFLSLVSWVYQLLRAPFTKKLGYRVTRPRSFIEQTITNTETGHKFKIKVESEIDYYVLEQIFVKEHYSLRSNPLFSEINDCYQNLASLKQALPLIIDCGANIGLSVRYFSDQYPKSRIVAIEPSERNISVANINIKEIKTAELIHGAVGSERGYCKIENNEDSTWAFQVTESNAGPIPVYTVQDLMSYTNEKLVPFIIKIDIEGSEQDLFSKNTEWMEMFPIIMIELHDWISPGSLISLPFLKKVAALDRDFYYNEENIISISVSLLNDMTKNQKTML